METTLHRQLKALYSRDESLQEVTVDGYRIDALDGERLIEIQQASLAAIRDKVGDLLERHEVHVVKPLAARKFLITRKRRGGPVVTSRFSPRKETPFHLFAELVHFVSVFPHPRLTLEIVLTEQEEHRVARRGRRRRSKQYKVEDRLLCGVWDRIELRTSADLVALLPGDLPSTFSTADLSRQAGIPRWLAQKAAYCLRKTGAVELAGKSGNSLLYQFTAEAVTNRAA